MKSPTAANSLQMLLMPDTAAIAFPLVIGGDHALGIGSIAGTARTIPAKDLSVIWIDAHTDINTDETSESHNIHGMPLAACLGLGDKRLFETMASPVPFLLPENLFYIGSRSIDPGEEEILKKYNIRAIRMEEIRQKGIEACCQELLDAVKTSHIHLCFDVDFRDAAEFYRNRIARFRTDQHCSNTYHIKNAFL